MAGQQRLLATFRIGGSTDGIEYVCLEAGCGQDDGLKKRLLKRVTSESNEKKLVRVEAQHPALPTLLGEPHPHKFAVAHLVPLRVFLQLLPQTPLYGVLQFANEPSEIWLSSPSDSAKSAGSAAWAVDSRAATAAMATGEPATTENGRNNMQAQQQQRQQQQQQQQQQQHGQHGQQVQQVHQDAKHASLAGVKRTNSDRIVRHVDANSDTHQPNLFVVLDLDFTLIECRPASACPPGCTTIDVGHTAGCAAMLAFVRPGVLRFLQQLLEARYWVMVVSAGAEQYVQTITDGLNRLVLEQYNAGPVIERCASCRVGNAVQQKDLRMVGINGDDAHRAIIVDDTRTAWQRRWRQQVLPIAEPRCCRGEGVDEHVFDRLMALLKEAEHYAGKGVRAADIVDAMLERDSKRLQGLTAAFGALLRHEAVPLYLPTAAAVAAPAPTLHRVGPDPSLAPPIKLEPDGGEPAKGLAVKAEHDSHHGQAL